MYFVVGSEVACTFEPRRGFESDERSRNQEKGEAKIASYDSKKQGVAMTGGPPNMIHVLLERQNA